MAMATTDFTSLASDASVETTVAALRSRGFDVVVADTAEDARVAALALIPLGAAVLTAASVTVDAIGLGAELNQSGKYKSIRAMTAKMDRASEGQRIRQLIATPDYGVGSVHALTEDGQVLVASGSGSQVAGYVYGAEKLIWIVGTQKIVSTLEEGIERVERHSHPLENERMQAAFGRNSSLNKLVIYRGETNPGRVTIILVREALGF
jgi:hypothetical protein